MTIELTNPPLFYLSLCLVASFTWIIAHLFITSRLKRSYDNGYLDAVEHQHRKRIQELKDSMPIRPTETAPLIPQKMQDEVLQHLSPRHRSLKTP